VHPARRQWASSIPSTPKTCSVFSTTYPDSDAFCPEDGSTLRLNDGAALLVGSVVADRYLVSRLRGGELDAAHRINIVYRDLKPDNVLVVTDEQGLDLCKVVDIGSAKALNDGDTQRTQRTQVGDIIGPPESMSPEQLLGEAIDARSDVYALAVVAFHLLTGTLPFWRSHRMHADGADLRRNARLGGGGVDGLGRTGRAHAALCERHANPHRRPPRRRSCREASDAQGAHGGSVRTTVGRGGGQDSGARGPDGRLRRDRACGRHECGSARWTASCAPS
jgi:hypothetical protein